MDWNNINRDRDTSGLGPIEYDQTKVPELIRKHADDVRTKTYGQEVREAQARNAELAGLMSSEAINEARTADLLSKDTQNRFNDQIAGTTNSDEVIDARRPFGRDTFATLGERLDFTEKDVNSRGVNVTWFGATGDGVFDNSQSVRDAISFAISNGFRDIYIPYGRYYFEESVNVSHNGLRLIGAGRRNTTLVFKEGIDAIVFASAKVGMTLSKLALTTTRPENPEVESNWLNNTALKFATVSEEVGGTEIIISEVNVSNFYKGMNFRDFLWQSKFEEVRFNLCGYSIYQEDSFGHTSMQNIFDHIYSNNPYFGGLRINNMQAEFINLNMGSSNESAYLMNIERSSNLLFTVPNFEHAYVSATRKETIMIKNDSNVPILNPSFKDLISTDSTIPAWVGVYNNALVNVRNHKIYQTGSIRLGTIYNRGLVNGQLDVSLTPLWGLAPDADGTYKQRLDISKVKSVTSNKIVLAEDSINRTREYLFLPSNRGKVTQFKAIYLAPHPSGYGELEVYQLIGSSKIKLANMPVKSATAVNKYEEVSLNVQTGKFESSSPVYVGGYGLGTLQVVCNYEE